MRFCMDILLTIWIILQSLFLLNTDYLHQNAKTQVTFAPIITLHLEFKINWIIILHICFSPSGFTTVLAASKTIQKVSVKVNSVSELK